MNILIMIALLAITIIIHEVGHFIACKYFGVEVPVFSVGFGKRLFGYSWRGTDYRVSMIPLGGYVNPDIDKADISDGKKIIIFLAGPAMNFLLGGVILFGHSLMKYGIEWKTFIGPFVLPFYIMTDMMPAFFHASNYASPIGITREGAKAIAEYGWLLVLMVLNYSVWSFNILPIGFLDGGKVVETLLNSIKPRAGTIYIGVTSIVLLIMVLIGFVNDIF